MALVESILWCYNDWFGSKTQIGILHSSRLTWLHDSNTIWELSSGTEYVNKVCVKILREDLEQYDGNAARYTLFKSVTVTHN